MYVLILKAMYGMIESALLWYDMFSKALSYLGFKCNPYERCIAKKVIDEHQCTIGWFLDNSNVSHLDDDVNSIIADKIEEKIGKISVTTGNKNTVLGMDIEFIGIKKVSVSSPYHFGDAL